MEYSRKTLPELEELHDTLPHKKREMAEKVKDIRDEYDKAKINVKVVEATALIRYANEGKKLAKIIEAEKTKDKDVIAAQIVLIELSGKLEQANIELEEINDNIASVKYITKIREFEYKEGMGE